MDGEDDARIESIPVADTQATGLEGSPFVNQQFPVRQPAVYQTEFIVPVLASSLRAARGRLKALSSPKFPWRELALAVSMLAFGTILSAWVSDVRLDSEKGVVFFVAMPVVAAASFVAYLFLHRADPFDRTSLEEVVQYLPDPDDTAELGAPE